ncbi:MAG: UDP-3-O-(3-hydroxymyristoyl)glucosamine N-acyltransferase [Leptolyngbyaceae cyanobacterium CRU_2_3]|nr:UDP-3-O-(3-hydroxymyristoyl)glucosamine N-acyltransferase [Leptolyngbyaceae cyanobacterium CRU_2_3]
MKFSELTEKLGVVPQSSLLLQASCNPNLIGVSALEEAQPQTLSYIEGDKFAAQLQTTAASALILPMNQALQTQATDRQIAWISSPEPRLLFAQAIALFYQPFRMAPGIHPTAVIDPSVQLGAEVAIGAHVVIQPGVTIGNQVCIHPNVVIYPGVQIGDRTTLHANCVIHERTQIGADCVIHSGAVIGSEGFGFVPIAEGWLKMEQSGYTVLEDGVEVGCNSAIDRPAVGETRIGRNTKLDNLVQIGHGCKVGKNCALAAQVGLAGGAQVGDRVMLGGQVGVANQAKIGNGVQAGAQSGLHGTVEPGTVLMGTPAVPFKVYVKASAIFGRLPEMHQALKQIQRQLGNKPK